MCLHLYTWIFMQGLETHSIWMELSKDWLGQSKNDVFFSIIFDHYAHSVKLDLLLLSIKLCWSCPAQFIRHSSVLTESIFRLYHNNIFITKKMYIFFLFWESQLYTFIRICIDKLEKGVYIDVIRGTHVSVIGWSWWKNGGNSSSSYGFGWGIWSWWWCWRRWWWWARSMS